MTETEASRGAGKTGRLIAGVALVAVVLALWRPWIVSTVLREQRIGDDGTPTPIPAADQLADKVASSLKAAREAQQQKLWAEAVTKWNEVLDVIPTKGPDADGFLIEELEARRNLAIVEHSAKAEKIAPPIMEVVVVPPPPEDQKPKKLSEDDLIAWYPEGRTVRSIGLLHVSGRGSNRDWGLKGINTFEYIYEVNSETKVTKNNAATGRLTFEQQFLDVVQKRAVSTKTLELDLPNSMMANVVWGQLEKHVLELVPGYIQLKKAGQVVDLLDPNLKQTLTTFQKWLNLKDGDNVELTVMLDRLSGTKLQIDYVSGIGVVDIKRLGGAELTPDELLQLAHSSTLLMDYFIFPAANQQVGNEWDVRAADVGNMTLPTMSEMKLDGTIIIHRDKDIHHKDGSKLAHLDVVAGKIKLVSDDEYRDQQGEVTVESGVARFSLDDKIVRDARLKFRGKLDIKSKNHLLFNTEQMRDIRVDSRYEAELVKPSVKK